MVSLTHKNRSDRRVICDICGQAYRLADVTKVTDKNNNQFGMIVCSFDRDPTNPQDIPFTVKDVILSSPKMVRDRGEITFDTNAYDDRVPSAPKNGFAQQDSLSGSIINRWDGPSNTGSSGVIGYSLLRASPRAGGYDSLVANTGNGSGFAIDPTGVLTGDYSYKVAAINSFGTGAYSEEWFFPASPQPPTNKYIVTSQDEDAITTGSGDYILYHE